MADATNETQTSAEPAVTRESLLSEQQRYIDKFGAENGVTWFGENKSYEEALELFSDGQAKKIVALETELSEAKEKLSSLSLGEDEPVETGSNSVKEKTTFAEATARKN